MAEHHGGGLRIEPIEMLHQLGQGDVATTGQRPIGTMGFIGVADVENRELGEMVGDPLRLQLRQAGVAALQGRPFGLVRPIALGAATAQIRRQSLGDAMGVRKLE